MLVALFWDNTLVAISVQVLLGLRPRPRFLAVLLSLRGKPRLLAVLLSLRAASWPALGLLWVALACSGPGLGQNPSPYFELCGWV